MGRKRVCLLGNLPSTGKRPAIMNTYWIILPVLFIPLFIWGILIDQKNGIKSPKERKAIAADLARPQLDVKIICPHCTVKGKVCTSPVKAKKGISGGKATGALLTGGLSVFATGLSRKENQTSARCLNCGSRWAF